jgi:predicted NUDIX family NTP pyrophosphohydrolase
MQLSTGILIYHFEQGGIIKVLLVHPGGPFFSKKDKGFWTIPKGLPEEGESLLNAAKREFEEETGYKIPENEAGYIDLGEVKQKSGKMVHVFALEHSLPDDWVHKSNTFQLEWPPKSSRFQNFPEMDKAQYFDIEEAKEYINEAQAKFLDRLEEKIKAKIPE